MHVQSAKLPAIVVSCASTNLPGENKLPANIRARAEKLPVEVYLSGQLIPGSRSRGGSICQEKRYLGRLSALISMFSRQFFCPYIPCQAGYSQEEWTPLLIHEKMAGHWDAQSHALCKLNQNNCKQDSPWDCCQLEALVVSSKPWIDACWWRGSINFTIMFGNRL